MSAKQHLCIEKYITKLQVFSLYKNVMHAILSHPVLFLLMLLYMYLFHVMMSHIYIIFSVQPACCIPANHPDLRYTGAWTSGQLSGDTDSFMWATGLPVTQHIDPSKLGTHLALEIDLKLHRYNGSSDKMGKLAITRKLLRNIFLYL